MWHDAIDTVNFSVAEMLEQDIDEKARLLGQRAGIDVCRIREKNAAIYELSKQDTLTQQARADDEWTMDGQ